MLRKEKTEWKSFRTTRNPHEKRRNRCVAPFRCQKSSPNGELFCREAHFACSPAARRAVKSVRKALLRKAAETGVHAAGFGMKIGGLRPSDASRGVPDGLKGVTTLSRLFHEVINCISSRLAPAKSAYASTSLARGMESAAPLRPTVMEEAKAARRISCSTGIPLANPATK